MLSGHRRYRNFDQNARIAQESETLNVRFIPAAKRELFAASEFYDRRVPGLGTQFLDDVEHAIVLIREYPHAWPQKYGNGVGVDELSDRLLRASQDRR